MCPGQKSLSALLYDFAPWRPTGTPLDRAVFRGGHGADAVCDVEDRTAVFYGGKGKGIVEDDLNAKFVGGPAPDYVA